MKYKYTIDHIKEVQLLVNKKGITKRQAISQVGFSDSSMYYNTLKRLRLEETLGLESRVSFL